MRSLMIATLVLLAAGNLVQGHMNLKQTQQLAATEKSGELCRGNWLSAGREVNRKTVTIWKLREELIALQQR